MQNPAILACVPVPPLSIPLYATSLLRLMLAQQPFLIVAIAKCEIRGIIRFLNALFHEFREKGIQPIEIHRQLAEMYGEKCMDIKNVRKWCKVHRRSYENSR